jgi:hypothetical protein
VRCPDVALLGEHGADTPQRCLQVLARALHIEPALTRAAGRLVATQAAAESGRVVAVEGGE